MCSVIKRWVPLWICFWYEILVYGSGMSFWYEFVSGKSFWYNFVSDMSFCYEFVSGMKFICVVLWVCSLIILYLMNWHYNFIVMIFFPPISCHSISLRYFWKTYATYQAAYLHSFFFHSLNNFRVNNPIHTLMKIFYSFLFLNNT